MTKAEQAALDRALDTLGMALRLMLREAAQVVPERTLRELSEDEIREALGGVDVRLARLDSTARTVAGEADTYAGRIDTEDARG